MVGGEKEIVERCMPLFEAMGKTITHIGPVGSGQVTKLVNQVLIAVNLLAASEALTFAAKCGVDPEKVLAAVTAGSAGSWQLANLGPKMLARDFEPGFMIRLLQKDLRLASPRPTGSKCRCSVPPSHQLCAPPKGTGTGRGTQAMVKVIEKLPASSWGAAKPARRANGACRHVRQPRFFYCSPSSSFDHNLPHLVGHPAHVPFAGRLAVPAGRRHRRGRFLPWAAERGDGSSVFNQISRRRIVETGEADQRVVGRFVFPRSQCPTRRLTLSRRATSSCVQPSPRRAFSRSPVTLIHTSLYEPYQAQHNDTIRFPPVIATKGIVISLTCYATYRNLSVELSNFSICAWDRLRRGPANHDPARRR